MAHISGQVGPYQKIKLYVHSSPIKMCVIQCFDLYTSQWEPCGLPLAHNAQAVNQFVLAHKEY